MISPPEIGLFKSLLSGSDNETFRGSAAVASAAAD